MKKRQHEAFPDGIAEIYDNQAKSGVGNIPRDKLVLRYKLHMREKTVGINRFYSALQNNSLIERTYSLEGRMNEAEHDIRDLKGGK